MTSTASLGISRLGQIAIRVQTPTWAPVDTVEIFANATFDVPYPQGTTPAPPPPILCFTLLRKCSTITSVF